MVDIGGELGRTLGTLAGKGISEAGGNALRTLLDELTKGDIEKESNMLKSVLELVQQSGGINSVLELFSENGLGSRAESWVGNGSNEDIAPEQVRQIFDGRIITGIASKLGVDSEEAGSIMAKVLPELVNQVTPEGLLSDGIDDLISRGLSLLGG